MLSCKAHPRLALVADRTNLLGGLCAQLGVDEHSGQLADGVEARGLDVRFSGENGVGDGLRREWLTAVVAEILSIDRGVSLAQLALVNTDTSSCLNTCVYYSPRSE